jgi:hypothetical protein
MRVTPASKLGGRRLRGLSSSAFRVMPEEVVEWYARDGWRGRLEPYVAYWTEDAEAGEAGRRGGLGGAADQASRELRGGRPQGVAHCVS